MFRQSLWQFCRTHKCSDVRSMLYASRNHHGSIKCKGIVTRKVTPPEFHGCQIRQVSTSSTAHSDFIRNLFLGKFNKDDVLPYPEITAEEFTDLNQMVEPIEKFFAEEIDSKAIDTNAEIDERILTGLKELGLFGQQIPQEYGGLELSYTAYARIAEVTALDASIALTLSAHQASGLKGILLAGSDEQKSKYLPKLATGEHIAAFCLTEPTSGSDLTSIKTRASLHSDGTHYLLNGTKIWVTNGGKADIFIVFAKTEIQDKKANKVDKLTAFIVDKSFGGVTRGLPQDKLGVRGANTCQVSFDSVPVPVENVLGEIGAGYTLASKLLSSGQFSIGSTGAGVLKNLLGMVVEHASSRKQFDTKLSDFGQIQEKIARIAMSTYALESMTYLTAGLLDRIGDGDLSLHASILKIYSSESCWHCISEALQVLGGLGYMKDYPYERCLRDSKILSLIEGTNEVLRLNIALEGFQYAGSQIGVDLTKGFNSHFFRMITPFRKMDDLLAGIADMVHPDLKESGQKLDRSIALFHSSVRTSIAEYTKGIIDEQLILNKYTDIVIDIYAMTACLSRASRSKTLGLPNCDHEILLTKAICDQAYGRFLDNFDDIRWGPEANNDLLKQELGKEVCDYREYKAFHPLTIFWS